MKTRLFKHIEILPPKKLKNCIQNTLIFLYLCSKNRLWVLVRTASRGVLTSTQNLCFGAEKRKIMYTPVNPSFSIQKWGLKESKSGRHVFVMYSKILTCSVVIKPFMPIKGTLANSVDQG